MKRKLLLKRCLVFVIFFPANTPFCNTDCLSPDLHLPGNLSQPFGNIEYAYCGIDGSDQTIIESKFFCQASTCKCLTFCHTALGLV
jgi:hypothetical protein